MKQNTIRGRGEGKPLYRAFVEVTKALSICPPVTAEEAKAFCQLQIKRCNMNLANAKDRKDKRAVIHLERKLAVYEYLYQLAKAEDPKV